MRIWRPIWTGEHLCRGYCHFSHCHCRPQPTFELTSLHRVSFQPAIMWWKDCRALHKTFVLMKNIVSHFFHLFKLEVFDRENNFDADPCFSSDTSRKFLFDCQNLHMTWFKVSRHTYYLYHTMYSYVLLPSYVSRHSTLLEKSFHILSK